VRRSLLVLLIVSLALAASAAAKNLTVAQVCGPDDCAPLDRQSVMPLLGGSGSQSPPPAAYYRLDFTFETPDGVERRSISHLYVPSAHLVAAGGEVGEVVWFPVKGATLKLLDRATREVEPFGAPAAWPTSIGDPVFTPAGAKAPSAGAGTNWTAWLLATVAFLSALAAASLFARRLRGRQTRPVGA
jgi:hypothetical protein